MGILDKIVSFINGAEVASAAYKPTTPYTGGLPSGKVKRGSKGTDVKRTQKFLNWCIAAGLSVDGKCGKHTVSAIKKYQKQYKLKVDGVFGSQSKKKAKSIIAKYAPAPTPAPTPAPAPAPTAPTRRDTLLATAASLIGSAKSPTAAYKAALKKAYPSKKGWGAAARAGRSCDVFVGTVMRTSGQSANCPRGLKEQYKFKPTNFTRHVYHNVTPKSVSQTGDVVIYKKKGGGGHACIRTASGIYQANNPKYYPHYTAGFSKLATKRPTVIIWRAK